jgi:membrane associated rhomboid family serine protease
VTYQSDPSPEPGTPPPRRREPIFNRMPVGVALLIGLILVSHLATLLMSNQSLQILESQAGVTPASILSDFQNGRYQVALVALIASQFLHGGPLHLVMNLAMLLQSGPIAELGLSRHRHEAIRFILFFLVCGISGGLTYCWINPDSQITAIGASGAISGVFAGFLWAAIGLAKPGQAMLKPVLTSGAVFLLINVGLAWVGRVTNFLPIAWECHLGGFVAGLIFYPLFARLGRVR